MYYVRNNWRELTVRLCDFKRDARPDIPNVIITIQYDINTDFLILQPRPCQKRLSSSMCHLTFFAKFSLLHISY